MRSGYLTLFQFNSSIQETLLLMQVEVEMFQHCKSLGQQSLLRTSSLYLGIRHRL